MSKKRIEIPCASGDGNKTVVAVICDELKIEMKGPHKINYFSLEDVKKLRDALDCYINSDGKTLKEERYAVEAQCGRYKGKYRIVDNVTGEYLRSGDGCYLEYDCREKTEKAVALLNELEGE